MPSYDERELEALASYRAYVEQRLEKLTADEDLSKFIL